MGGDYCQNWVVETRVLLQFGGSFSQSGGMLRIMGVVHISKSVGLCKLVGYVQNHGVVKIRRYGQNHGVCSESWGSQNRWGSVKLWGMPRIMG